MKSFIIPFSQRAHVTLLILLLALYSRSLSAMPADPSPVRWTQPDGTTLTVTLWGDEHAHGYLSPDGYLLAPDEAGWMCYARTLDGQSQPTAHIAHDPSRRTPDERTFLATLGTSQARALHRQALAHRPVRTLGLGGETTYPTTGKRRALAFLIDFPEADGYDAIPFTYTSSQIADLFNKPGFNLEDATGSVRDYFLASSAGQFDLTFDVFGPVTMPQGVGIYGKNHKGGDTDAWQMVVDACRQLDDQINFADYDLDGDGFIDNIYVIYAGYGEATGAPEYTIWPHAGDIEKLKSFLDPSFQFDGVTLNHYACSNELRKRYAYGSPSFDIVLEGIGTVCHEFTHVLGFPDLYSTRKSQPGFTPGQWSIMDIGAHNNYSRTPPVYSSYERLCMGWIHPLELVGPADLTLDTLSTSNQACLVKTVRDNEFFLFENRQQSGWDHYLPGHGMLVWHITYSPTAWDKNEVNVGDTQLIDLVEADDVRNESSRADDTFPGGQSVTSFTDDTQPSMRTSWGERTGRPITSIREAGGLITFRVDGGAQPLEPLKLLEPESLTDTSFIARWAPVTQAGVTSQISVYTLSGPDTTYVQPYHHYPVGSADSCLVVGLTPETTYHYTLRPVSYAGQLGPVSPEQTLTTLAAPITGLCQTPAAQPAYSLTRLGSHSLQVSQLPAGSPVALYALSGLPVSRATAFGGSATLHVPAPGIYLLVTPGGSQKVSL